MKRSYILLFPLAVLAGCTAPASSLGSGSFWSSERGKEINSSLDRTGSHVAKMEQAAEEIKSDIE
jgi:hypothetical protein